jgi:hypothetical protein
MTDEQLAAIEARLTQRTCARCGAIDPPTEDSENVFGDHYDTHINCPSRDEIGHHRVAVHGIARAEQIALVAEVRRLRGALLDAAAEHQRERLAWSDRKVELLERIVALEARGEGER